MKLLNLAVASIVDANTGNGVNNNFIEQFASATSGYERRGREIRAKSILAGLGKIKAAIGQYIENSKARAQERRDTKALLAMNDHLLSDIGLTQDDVRDLRWGQTSLEALNARRELNRLEAIGQMRSHSLSSVTSEAANTASVNQENYESKKCA